MEELQRLNDFIYAIPHFEDFINSSSSTYKDVELLLNDFLKYIIDKEQDTSEIRIMVHIAIEQYAAIIEKSHNTLYYINNTKRYNDEQILRDFTADYAEARTGEYLFKRAEIQRYKTLTEKIAFSKINFSQETINKYINCSHPYICAVIATAFINAKFYDVGLHFLKNGLKNFCSYQNVYWHNPVALKGCADILHLTQYVLASAGMISTIGFDKLMKMLYLYISRVIYMGDIPEAETIDTNSDNISQHIIDKINYLSIRGDLEYDYRNFIISIFPTGVNPYIQFMADKAMADAIAKKYGLGQITEQCFKDSLKMYQHGSLIPNWTGGYHDIEDETWGELIQRGTNRAYNIAYDFYLEYINGDYQVSEEEIDKIISYLKKKYKV